MNNKMQVMDWDLKVIICTSLRIKGSAMKKTTRSGSETPAQIPLETSSVWQIIYICKMCHKIYNSLLKATFSNVCQFRFT